MSRQLPLPLTHNCPTCHRRFSTLDQSWVRKSQEALREDLILTRRRLGLTQRQLAKRLGFSGQMISLIERGATPVSEQFAAAWNEFKCRDATVKVSKAVTP